LSTANDAPSEQWLAYAVGDLAWTRGNINGGIWHGACFTAQQAAEKALKAYIVSKRQTARRIHDLGALLEECVKLDNSFDQFKDECITLTEYYTVTRYPDKAQYADFTEAIAKEAYDFAEKIVTFVKEKLLG